MKNLFCVIYLFLSVFVITGCGTSKGYIGKKIPKSELSVIRGLCSRSAKDRLTFNLEKVLIVKVDTLIVGSYNKGWPKQVKVLPGKRIVEIRHFKAWDNRNNKTPYVYGGGFLGGFASGLEAGANNEEYNTHYHYILTFDVEKGKNYSILFKTSDSKINKPEIFITEDKSGTSIPFEVVEKFYKKYSVILNSQKSLK